MSMDIEEGKKQVLEWFIQRKGKPAKASSIGRILSRDMNLNNLMIAQILKSLFIEGDILSSQNDVRYGNLSCNIAPPVTASETLWQSCLHASSDSQMLLPCHTSLSEWPLENLQKLLDGLLHLKKDLPDSYSMTAYEASARYLLSSSKLLNSLDKQSLLTFGIDTDRFQSPVTYMVIAGPARPEQVLLIENPQSFEACLRLGLHQHTGLLCTYGYGMQWNQVLDNLSSVHGIIRAGDPGLTIETLLDHDRLFFWGDLDYAGLNIYQSIQKRIPHCLLSHLYLPMVKRAHSGQSHRYCDATGKGKQSQSDSSIRLTSAVDQESLSDSEISDNFNEGITLDQLEVELRIEN